MIWKRGLESTGDVDLTQIFGELRDRGIEAEKNKDTIIYQGEELSFEIKEDEVKYTQVTGISMQNDLEALDFIQRTLKSDYGFEQKSVEAEEANLTDSSIDIAYSEGE
jgi:hypothetical protein